MVGINYTVILVFIVFFDTTSKLMTNDVPIFLCLCISITHYTHTKVKTYWILRFMKEARGIVFLKKVVKKYHDNYCIDRVCIEKKHTYTVICVVLFQYFVLMISVSFPNNIFFFTYLLFPEF